MVSLFKQLKKYPDNRDFNTITWIFFRLYNIRWGGKIHPNIILQKKLHLKPTHCKIMLLPHTLKGAVLNA